jgi:CBS domain-containing protein
MNATVSDILRIKGSAVECIAPDATILEAIKRMSARRFGCLAVVGKNGRLCGIITERDCMWKTIAVGDSPRTMRVQDKMTPITKMSTVTPGHTVDDCMSLMTDERHRHLPVVEGRKLVGLVSIGDVVKFLIGSHQAMIQSLQKYIEGSL